LCFSFDDDHDNSDDDDDDATEKTKGKRTFGKPIGNMY
jgi:hypothetical protein